MCGILLVKSKTHTDGIWISEEREKEIVKQLSEHICGLGYIPTVKDQNNFGYPYGNHMVTKKTTLNYIVD